MKVNTILSVILISILVVHSSFAKINPNGATVNIEENTILFADPPVLKITRDDHVATVEMDFDENAGHGGNLWTVGLDGTDPVGYLVRWWPDASESSNVIAELGCVNEKSLGTTVIATAEDPHEMVSANPIVQIQPLANDVLYHLKVAKLNSKGEICSAFTELTFQGGDGSRVNALRSELTFFDDFNLPQGPADELKWNNAMTPQTDPRFNLFFVNKQCHTHTLAGTLNGGAGDKSQVAQRARKPILIEEGVRRKIVFDMDGIFSPRSVWYLDLNPVKTDLTGHMSFFDSDGDTGLPADVFRIKSKGHEIFVHLINEAGEVYNVESVDLSDYGRALSTNVRRFFDVRLGTDGVEIFVDGTSVLSASFEPGSFKAGKYDLLWSTIGYNTSKDDNPYFLSHWDNFGFDGPNVEPYVVHNYVTRIAGTDLQKAHRNSGKEPVFTINVPDDIRPLSVGVTNEVYLVWTYMKNDFSTFSIQAGDYFTFNGQSFPLPMGANNSTDPDLVNYAGSTISNRIKIGEVESDGNSIVNVGDNLIQFFATNTGIVNVHLEVICPEDAVPPHYTRPSEIHPFVFHHDLPKLGVPAKIVRVDDEQPVKQGDGSLLGPVVSDSMKVEFLAGNTSWAGWAPHRLNIPSQSAEMWSVGSTNGIRKVELFIKPVGMDSLAPVSLDSVRTDSDGPAPQVRYSFTVDSKGLANGNYELFLQATDSKGVKSHPAYDGIGFKWDAQEFSGGYYPVIIEIHNEEPSEFVFQGLADDQWSTSESWNSGIRPPKWYNGNILINSNCVVGGEMQIELGASGVLTINEGYNLVLRK